MSEVKEPRIYELNAAIQVMFVDDRELPDFRVCITSWCLSDMDWNSDWKDLYFSNRDFEEFLSILDYFNDHWHETTLRIGEHNITFTQDCNRRTLKFDNFSWAPYHFQTFMLHIENLQKINNEWF
jgi:hypothetical protein